MKNKMIIFMSILIFSGCGSYTKVIHLSPEASASWKKMYLTNSWTYKSGCNEGEVIVQPLVIKIIGTGSETFFIPSPNRDKEQLKTLDEKNPSINIRFRHMPRIESCKLSFISLTDQNFFSIIRPVSAEINQYDVSDGKYTTECIYSFDLNKDTIHSYNLNVSEEVFNCKLGPIRYKFGKTTYYSPYQIM